MGGDSKTHSSSSSRQHGKSNNNLTAACTSTSNSSSPTSHGPTLRRRSSRLNSSQSNQKDSTSSTSSTNKKPNIDLTSSARGHDSPSLSKNGTVTQLKDQVAISNRKVQTKKRVQTKEKEQTNEKKQTKGIELLIKGKQIPKQLRKSTPKRSKMVDPLDKIIAGYKQCLEDDKNKINVKELQDFRKKFRQTCDTAKRDAQKIEQELAAKKRVGTTRSGTRRGFVKRAVYTDGKWINKGIDDSQDKYDKEELEYLAKDIKKYKKVNELKFEHLKYLVVDVYLNDLKAIKAGNLESDFHDRYKELEGKSKMDILSEIRTSLFTNEQRDYINGLLQGAFDTTSKDDNGDIKHSDINYVEIVMLAEITIRIVKYVHKFESSEETFEFMLKNSREALGLGDDDDDD